MNRVSIDSVKRVVLSVLRNVNVDEKSAIIILDTILYSNRREITTHGIGRLPLYVKKIQSGHLNPANEIETLRDFGAIELLDAHGTFGQVAAYEAIKRGIKKAEKYGVSSIGVINSNNFGAAGYFGNMAAEAGMAAMIYANAAPAIAPTGGIKPIFGTNPICFSFPGGNNSPIVLDMATTIVARGKIRAAAKEDRSIPYDWALDKFGNPTNDPNEALEGSLLPIGGYKGYGLSCFVDIFCGLLTGGAFAGQVAPLSDLDRDSRNGHLFVLINANSFSKYENNIDIFYESVKTCGEQGAIYLPGEQSNQKMQINKDSIPIPEKQYREINELARKLGIDGGLEVC